ncbi:putative membrane protein insertion efficiency factor [Dillenia turbinata]|uniref:Membrane protein insertion efficiency factor n=1 Tax=Dillenia turbinata TaxID=194707 RepID=A0AAN8ZN92_9MAGN
MLKFHKRELAFRGFNLVLIDLDLKREISPLLPKSCRYVPTCSEYSMQAFEKHGIVRGTGLTAWRLCRCNPLGGSGFDPPRWFDEPRPSEDDQDI